MNWEAYQWTEKPTNELKNLPMNWEAYQWTEKPTNELKNLPMNWEAYHRDTLSATRWKVYVNFSRLTHNNQIFRNVFGCNHYRLCKLSAQTIDCKIFTPYDFIQLLFYTYIFFGCTVRKKASTIQNGYRKWGTRARVFSPNTNAWEQQRIK